jgi:pimeloyl-ACP methyl ester carboxylesterase
MSLIETPAVLSRATLELAGHPVAHLAGGSGLPVLVLHDDADDVVERCWGLLAADRRIVAIDVADLSGDEPDRLLDALPWPTFSVVGAGAGVPTAIAVSALAADRCDRLVLVCAGVGRQSPAALLDGAFASRDEIPPTLLLWGTGDGEPTAEVRQDLASLSQASFAFVYDAGPDVAADRPGALAAISQDFLRRGAEFVRSAGSSVINP